MNKIAHSENESCKSQTITEHSYNVGQLAKGYAQEINLDQNFINLVEWTGYIHDIGKCGNNFAKVLTKEITHVDHSILGAYFALQQGLKIPAICSQGHHIGLQSGDPRELSQIARIDLRTYCENKKRIFSLDNNQKEKQIIEQFCKDLQQEFQIDIKSKIENIRFQDKLLEQFMTRLAASCLVDADHTDTSQHFSEKDESFSCLDIDNSINALKLYTKKNFSKSKSKCKFATYRTKLKNECVKTAKERIGLFSLTAPTGSGKTIATLAFALHHAKKHNLKRIIVVMPQLSIIEQTANLYKKIFADFGEHYILEHHSMSEDENLCQYGENWNNAIIITTTNQFFNSLFSNKTTYLKKLHNYSNSVVIFDEPQSLPIKLIRSTLKTLDFIPKYLHSSILFSTATQPNVNAIIDTNVIEIVKNKDDLFRTFDKVTVDFISEKSWSDIKQIMIKNNQCLCIVNLKRHAKQLYKLFVENGIQAYHLSTNMCPSHRLTLLKEVQKKLNNNEQCYLISTQCIEAGVDIDFPVVIRALAPLEGIIQAFGRCNREGKLDKGKGIVFIPKDDNEFPSVIYQIGAGKVNTTNIDLNNLENIAKYWAEMYYDVQENLNLIKYIDQHDYVAIEKEYDIIKSPTIPILVPYNMEKFEELTKQEFSKKWARKARPYCVNVYPQDLERIIKYCKPLINKKNKKIDWYILNDVELYNDETGLEKIREEM
jgi:CRISPR-associated endonuclease/helicase Cas3